MLWRGDAAIPGAHEMITLMRSLGKRVVFVVRLLAVAFPRIGAGNGHSPSLSLFMYRVQTNNSTKSRDTYVKKLGMETNAMLDTKATG